MIRSTIFAASLLALLAFAPIKAGAADEAGLLRNAKCPYSGKESVGDQFIVYADADAGVHARIHTCCGNCKAKGEAAADKKALYEKAYLAGEGGKKIEYGKPALEIKNKKCPVMGEEVKGDKVSLNYNGAKVLFCCEGCQEDFLKEPDKHLSSVKADIDAAIAEKKKAAEAK